MYIAASVAVSVLLLSVVLSGVLVVRAAVERTYDLAGGDAVVYHRYGLTTNGNGYLLTVTSVSIPKTITVCARLHTGFSYDDVYPVIDHGVNNGVNWAIEAVPQYDYRIRVEFGDGEASVVVPGERFVPHVYCFRIRSAPDGYYLDVFVDGQLYTTVQRSYAMLTVSYAIYIGTYLGRTKYGMYTTITLFLLYNRPLNDSEIASIAAGVIPYSGLLIYFDPTVWDYNQGVWVDLSGNGNNFRPGAPLNNYIDLPDMFVIKGRYSDNYVHFQYFPWYSRLEVYNSAGNLVTGFTVGGVDNGYGQVIDLAVPLDPDVYKLVYYDPNEGVTTTVTAVEIVTETVVTTSIINYTTTSVINYTTTASFTTTSTVAVPVVSYSTVTVTATEYAVPRWEWIVVVLMIMVLGASAIYLFAKLR
jgi:hypothetical protein